MYAKKISQKAASLNRNMRALTLRPVYILCPSSRGWHIDRSLLIIDIQEEVQLSPEIFFSARYSALLMRVAAA